jgi:hypothetical protein
MLHLPRRGGGGVERGGDACIALGGAFFTFHLRFVLEPQFDEPLSMVLSSVK